MVCFSCLGQISDINCFVSYFYFGHPNKSEINSSSFSLSNVDNISSTFGWNVSIALKDKYYQIIRVLKSSYKKCSVFLFAFIKTEEFSKMLYLRPKTKTLAFSPSYKNSLWKFCSSSLPQLPPSLVNSIRNKMFSFSC